ncbi:MAG: Mrp/NBP35 family ATP-binding protein [Microbacteriaceae bacterium]
MTSPDAVRNAVGAVVDPELRRPLSELGMVGDVSVDGAGATVEVRLTIAACPKQSQIEDAVRAAALGAGVDSVTVSFGVMSDEERQALSDSIHGGRSPEDRFGLNSLTRVIAVTSGKGGVGKSTVSANLAVSLARRGLKVGLLDADVFGFSIPSLMGIEGEKPTKVADMILPPVAHDVSVISIGMFVDPHTPVSWRGPMLHRTVRQFLADVYYGDIDVLVCDLPPGTGDVAISLGQMVPHADVVVVTTPQSTASDVAERSGLVARQLGQNVIGVIENMSDWTDDDGTRHSMFGTGGGKDVADRLGVPLLGEIPLTPGVIAAGNAGTPVVLESGDAAATAMGAITDAIVRTAKPRGNASLPLSF